MPEVDYSAGPKQFEKLQKLLSDQKNISVEIDAQLKQFEKLQSELSGQSKISLEIDKQLPGKASRFQAVIKTRPELLGDTLIVTAKKIISSGKIPVMVLTARNYRVMIQELENAGIETKKVVLVDCVTKNIFCEKDKENIFFADSLADLPGLEIKIIELVEAYSKAVFVFDSLDILRLFHSDENIFKFIHSITKILRKNSVNAYYFFGSNYIVSKISQFFDYSVEIE
ncbi:MAG: hypothetical protein WC308_01135 [archaeon]|jgi:hypothetical protein